MLDKLNSIQNRFDEISDLIIQPSVITDSRRYIKLNKEYKELSKLVEAANEYKALLKSLDEAKQIISEGTDQELVELAKEELDELNKNVSLMEEEIKILMIPKDEEDSKNAMVEIRGGTGGDEAAIFAGDLYRMYIKHAETKNWKTELIDFSEGTMGGFKEIVFSISGENVYGTMKFEAGVHRVQRVPQTETQGRIHTSAATVMVFPEAEEFDVEINMKDIRKDLYCSSGPGGQSVNTTYSAVRLTHIPTGIVAQCQDQKSQLKNFDKALNVLRSRIYEMELQKKNEEDSKRRKSMVVSGDRSAKIRTYNYPQGRVTDHRIGLTVYNLQDVINGDIEKFSESLKIAENMEKLKEDEDFLG
ncbi:peptide chain release factor 1 [Ichthyobacterium seriolicida]|uniref:Peptide chain release factor 1 n=1 Tax=Ichthyobacterium seriolicida TaxID=242600 RepID=A0A1J1DXT1_9FLAO|nr:peptide chain release factor 1 [Ichthyobacterium seriolicida]BAV94679.1 peptide chain release factor 1 [Ichthyobacterium seriolicida]